VYTIVCFRKRQSKQWWSTNPPISTRSHPDHIRHFPSSWVRFSWVHMLRAMSNKCNSTLTRINKVPIKFVYMPQELFLLSLWTQRHILSLDTMIVLKLVFHSYFLWNQKNYLKSQVIKKSISQIFYEWKLSYINHCDTSISRKGVWIIHCLNFNVK
jgi:hypothetical protein